MAPSVKYELPEAALYIGGERITRTRAGIEEFIYSKNVYISLD
jgi:hypothetical protein